MLSAKQQTRKIQDPIKTSKAKQKKIKWFKLCYWRPGKQSEIYSNKANTHFLKGHFKNSRKFHCISGHPVLYLVQYGVAM